MNDLDLKYLIDFKKINVGRNIKGLTIEDLTKKLRYLSSRTVQVICSQNTLLKPPLIQALSATFDFPEYQLLAEIPNTYVFQGRLIIDGNGFANLMSSNRIIDVKWSSAEITHSESFEQLLIQIDHSEFEKGPLRKKEISSDASKLSFQERYKFFEENNKIYNEFCSKNKIQIWAIPVFKVFNLGLEYEPAFTWKTGVIIEFFKDQQHLIDEQKPLIIPNHLERVGEEKYYKNYRFKQQLQASALQARPNIQSVGNINFGNLDPNIMIKDKSDTRVSRVDNENSQELPIPTEISKS